MIDVSLTLAAADPGAARSLLDSILEWASLDGGWELAVLVFGVLAQALFFGRWVVQWLATERRGEPHVPESFWWISLAGAVLLFAYFALRGEPVGMLGQTAGWAIYARNLYLIRRGGSAPANAAGPAERRRRGPRAVP